MIGATKGSKIMKNYMDSIVISRSVKTMTLFDSPCY